MKTQYKNIKRIVIILMVFIGLSSCSDDFLEVTPKGVIIAQTVEDYDLLLNDLTLFILHFDLAELLTTRTYESCGVEPHFSSRYEGLYAKNNFTWEPDAFDPNTDVIWVNGLLKRIYVFNKIINEVPNATDGSEEEKSKIYSEALASRAATYYILINFFGKHYNENTASTDLGFPIITEADVTQTKFTRATVQEVYDFMINDLTTAIPELSSRVEERNRMSKGSGEALLGKIYVNMGQYQQATVQFDSAISHLQEQEGLEVGLYDYNTTTLPGGVHEVGFLGPSFVSYQVDIQHPYNIIGGASFVNVVRSDVLLSPEVSVLYGPNDIRLNHFFTNSPFFQPPFPVAGIYRGQGKLNNINLGVKLQDIYLLRAESNARIGNLSDAITDVEYLRSHRMPAIDALLPVGLSQNDLIKFIIDERTREFALLGELWFDMRRLWDDPLFSDRVYTHTLYNEDGSIKETYTLNEDRLVLRFTDKIMSQNPELINNP